jgi:hypothetical protein
LPQGELQGITRQFQGVTVLNVANQSHGEKALHALPQAQGIIDEAPPLPRGPRARGGVIVNHL